MLLLLTFLQKVIEIGLKSIFTFSGRGQCYKTIFNCNLQNRLEFGHNKIVTYNSGIVLARICQLQDWRDITKDRKML